MPCPWQCSSCENFSYLWTYDLYSPVHNAFDAGSIHYEGKWEGGWALDIESFLGPVKWHRADGRVPFGAQKTRDFQGPTSGLGGGAGA
jgi:hypothetical protein